MKKVLSIIITLLFITNINILSQNRGGMFHKFGSSVTLLMGTRQSDGSLPNLGNYFKLAQSSDAIDGGINVGLPYKGTAPDLGPFESDYNVLQDGDTKPIIFINKPIYFDGTIVIIK